MTRRFALIAAAAGLVLPQAAHGQEAAKPPTLAVKPNLAWKIKCHELSSVPLTADAVQALPMHIVTMLNCGDLVSVLSDAEGYTVNVRTADGKTGYVAGMYIAKAPPVKPEPRVEPTSAVVRDGVARWRRGANGCEQSMKDAVLVESQTANGVTVQVSLRDTGAKLRANVGVENASPLYVYVNPIGITLESRGAHWKSLAYQTPAQLANEATQVAGASPATLSVAYKVTDDSSLFPAAYIPLRHTAVEPASGPQISPAVLKAAQQFSAEALNKGVLGPEGKLSGAVWFERDGDLDQYVMRVPIDNQIFEFPVWLDQPK
jgi:hypothetical protein